VSLNVWSQNQRTDLIANFLLEANADIVVLAEIREQQRTRLLELLHSRYPHVTGSRGVVLFSKRPPLASGHLIGPSIDGWGRAPLIVWARFEREGMTFELAGAHLAWPFNPLDQVSDTDALIRFAKGRGVPLIVAGDFNLTPWSMKMQRFRRDRLKAAHHLHPHLAGKRNPDAARHIRGAVRDDRQCVRIAGVFGSVDAPRPLCWIRPQACHCRSCLGGMPAGGENSENPQR
jgi:endonuclease/exonuclease/phosphatase (EEP) superfamily protein YafD